MVRPLTSYVAARSGREASSPPSVAARRLAADAPRAARCSSSRRGLDAVKPFVRTPSTDSNRSAFARSPAAKRGCKRRTRTVWKEPAKRLICVPFPAPFRAMRVDRAFVGPGTRGAAPPRGGSAPRHATAPARLSARTPRATVRQPSVTSGRCLVSVDAIDPRHVHPRARPTPSRAVHATAALPSENGAMLRRPAAALRPPPSLGEGLLDGTPPLRPRHRRLRSRA